MTTTMKVSLAATCALAISLLILIGSSVSVLTASATASTPKVTVEPQREDLGKLVMGLVSVANPKLTLARKQILSRTFVRVANDIFEKDEDKREFAFVILAESSYNPKIQDSPVGAVGLSQLMPQFAKEFGKLCSINDFTTDDLREDTELNLTIGACLFRSLIEEYRGNSALAHAAYIAGKDSLSVKQLKNLHNLTDIATAAYLAKFFYLKEATRIDTMPIKAAMVR